MHPLIDHETVESIRATGNTSETLPERVPILEQYGIPFDRSAENVVITGCQILSALPQVLATLTQLLDRGGMSHTFLAKEYCCGNYLYRPVIKARDEAAMAECRQLSKEFVAKNIEQADELGAKRLIIFCSPCYPIYKHAFPNKDIIFYPAAIHEVMEPIQFNREIDYYAGCYRLHRKFSPVPMDLKSTDAVLAKMEGMKVHRISAPQCCFKPEGLAHMMGNIRTPLMLHICTGCYTQAVNNQGENKDTEIVMLPDLVQMALDQSQLQK